LLDTQPPATAATKVDEHKPVSPEQDQDAEHHGFQRSEKAAQAAQIDLSAKLGKDGLGGKKAGWREIWRLLQVARPESRKLALAFVLLLVSSSVTMSIPFSIGKIMDIATKSNGEGVNELFGLSVPMFYGALVGIVVLGAAANYGRIILLRIVGEKLVARQRSKLFRRTFIQDAEFF
jgi:putative ABC transport system ATP-binding protein